MPARRAGIRVPLFCSSPVCRTSSPLRLSPSSTDSTHSARKRGWTEEWAVLRGGGPLSVLRGPPPAPAGRLDLGARRQGLAPEAGRRSNTTQLRRLCYKLLSNTTEGGGALCCVRWANYRPGRSPVPKSSQIQPPWFFRSPRLSHGVYMPRPNVLIAYFHTGWFSINDGLFSIAPRGSRERKSLKQKPEAQKMLNNPKQN